MAAAGVQRAGRCSDSSPRRTRAGSTSTSHRWVVGLLALLACVGLGAWLAASPRSRCSPRAGAGLGAALGAVVVAAAAARPRRPHAPGPAALAEHRPRPTGRGSRRPLASLGRPAERAPPRRPHRGSSATASRVGVATGAYGVSFGAVVRRRRARRAADLRPLAAGVHRRLPVRPGRRARRRRGPALRRADRAAARHPQHPLRPPAGAAARPGAAGAGWPPPTCSSTSRPRCR